MERRVFRDQVCGRSNRVRRFYRVQQHVVVAEIPTVFQLPTTAREEFSNNREKFVASRPENDGDGTDSGKEP